MLGNRPLVTLGGVVDLQLWQQFPFRLVFDAKGRCTGRSRVGFFSVKIYANQHMIVLIAFVHFVSFVRLTLEGFNSSIVSEGLCAKPNKAQNVRYAHRPIECRIEIWISPMRDCTVALQCVQLTICTSRL